MSLALKKESDVVFDLGERNLTLRQLIAFAEIACALHKKNPYAFHEAWQIAKERLEITEYDATGNIPLNHIWMTDAESWKTASSALPFFYTQKFKSDYREIIFRAKSLEEIANGGEVARGLIRIAFAQYF